ncbi:hypothetical protein GTP23_20185 [Pseudoduganella sp. FT93W]|uniref:Outer membrane beta-barrel protein n=1 Tax=Duganella fentianensis TaxID=2692177 RepID=A0A845I660_9BURK|nr:XrtB/PEP-CTERM-associated polysaccharide biosynthesis outer membrane protein EpsL [Duganella fentianensis]MYN47366.1 hypothetical protein [Duganella fentianensis]
MLSSLDAAEQQGHKRRAAKYRAPAPVSAALCLNAMIVLAGSWSSIAAAGTYDGLHPYASLATSYDDNLFRLADSNPGYDNQRGDYSTQLQAGLLFSQIYGRQEINLQAKVSRVNFRHFSALNYNGRDMLAKWGWHLGAHLDGTLGVNYSQTLAPYTDVETRERNLRTERRPYLTAGWTLHPSWRVRGALTQNRYTYDLNSLAYNDRDENGAEIGVDYLASSGSTIGLQTNKARMKYDNLRRLSGQLVSADTDQDDVKLKVFWRITGISDVQFLGGRSRRTHSFYTERDSSGFNAELRASTALSGQWGADVSLWRKFEGVESNLVSYSLNTGAQLQGNWAVTSKVKANVMTRVQKRRFSGLLSPVLPANINDISHTSSVGVDYALLPSVQLGLSLFQDSRSGLASRLFSNGQYHAKGASFTLNLQY